MQTGQSSRSREQLLQELERLRKELSPEQYAFAVARIMDELKNGKSDRPAFAIT